MNALKQLNALFDLAAEMSLGATEQLILMHLFNKFNRRRWAESIKLSDSELLKLCGSTVTLSTLRRARSRLATRGLISYRAGIGRQSTVYHLVDLCERADTPVHSQADTKESVKTRTTADFSGTGASGQCDSPAHSRAHSQKNSYIRARDENIETTNKDKGDCVREEILKTWRIEANYPLSASCQRQLPALISRHGLQGIICAIETVRDIRTQVTFADVKTVLNLSTTYSTEDIRKAIQAVGMKRTVVTFDRVLAQLTRRHEPSSSVVKGVVTRESPRPVQSARKPAEVPKPAEPVEDYSFDESFEPWNK